MITINGRKMGKSYNNVIRLTELFSGDHPILVKAYSPMTVRFFILQTHYRSTLDFSNEALQAAEKGLKRLMEAYEWLKQLQVDPSVQATKPVNDDAAPDAKVIQLLSQLEEFMNDDFGTARVLANIFEMVPVINSLKDKNMPMNALSGTTLQTMKQQLQLYVEDILGLKSDDAGDDKLKEVMQVLIEIRKDAKAKKDWLTSDRIRNQLEAIGIEIKDEKDGGMSWRKV